MNANNRDFMLYQEAWLRGFCQAQDGHPNDGPKLLQTIAEDYQSRADRYAEYCQRVSDWQRSVRAG